ncbi:RimJ/RimL family protein N-acetyltransferase [Symbiobacterium terraclitae]|uniref:RimJ/RimL family protein N-acetyltransferase n=1 Tax=Symbiobacterium terraclitae TaxID=557451 RepID=A0ABS4JSH6_9FIRM|nr:GNAT family protein [Symbiobacterium terraclitae]MBP2018494.1 RimJ/RimL family protein N-acetyltransferase [Symbiobacterium terraclitae]
MAGVIWGEKAGIRPLRPGDAGALHRFMTDPEVGHLLYEDKSGLFPGPLLLAVNIWLNSLAPRPEWAIVNEQGRFIGLVRLWRISERNRSAMLTIYIGEKDHWGRGYGTDALRLVLREAFGPMDLHRVELHVFEFNRRAIRSYEKAGFVHEGVRRQALRRGSRYYDIVVMGITREEFFARERERGAAVQGQSAGWE